jgi:phosphohistidine phosphatase
MKIYFLRHGDADWPDWQGSDDDRPLTKKGKKELRRVAEYLSAHAIGPAMILSSPLPRAAETAEIVADELGLEVTAEPALAPGFDPEKLHGLLQQHAGHDLMLVGHEPSLSQGVAALSGGQVKLAKAGLARVDLEDPNQPHGQLIWLLSPKLMKD